jgi:hypothetical protein
MITAVEMKVRATGGTKKLELDSSFGLHPKAE